MLSASLHDLPGRALITSSVAWPATDYAPANDPGFRINRRASGSAPTVSFNPPATDKAPSIGVAIRRGTGPVPGYIRGRTLAASGLLHAEKTRERVNRSACPHAEKRTTQLRSGTRATPNPRSVRLIPFHTGNRAKLPSDALSAAIVARAVCVLLTRLRVLSGDLRVICRSVGC